ncbi:hypothetical protein BDN71DRAFT_1511402 [Pleurotus eryngii]|uniref:DUF6593 domain-containing protein n=1 Tax=Pleurotus eryngii TaxID=5323 RepID=A0A9P5ZNI1_PLEER|nr:hypothetical protein BDN71DRAFT_1511402 [Pleurotus eryngii]
MAPRPATANASVLLSHTRGSTVYYLHPNDVKECTITKSEIDGSLACYRITSSKTRSRTSMYKANEPSPFATVQRSFWSEKVTLRGKQPMKVGQWLRQPSFGVCPATFEEQERTYVWKADGRGLSLYSSEDQRNPIACFRQVTSKMVNGFPSIIPASLILRPEASAIQDLVIASFLILEHRHRINRTTAESQQERVSLQKSGFSSPSY